MSSGEPWTASERLTVVLAGVGGFVVASLLTPCAPGLGHGCGEGVLFHLAVAVATAGVSAAVVGVRRRARSRIGE